MAADQTYQQRKKCGSGRKAQYRKSVADRLDLDENEKPEQKGKLYRQHVSGVLGGRNYPESSYSSPPPAADAILRRGKSGSPLVLSPFPAHAQEVHTALSLRSLRRRSLGYELVVSFRSLSWKMQRGLRSNSCD